MKSRRIFPTNVISITDGQIYLEPDLFFGGVRPAINVGISVSRVGGNAQLPAMKKIAGSLRLDLAAFRELEAFAQLGTELDASTQRQLDRGRRMVELLKQPQYVPMDVIDQILSIHAGVARLPRQPSPRQGRTSSKLALLKHYRDEHMPTYATTCSANRKMTDELDEKLKGIVREFKKRFTVRAAVKQ